MDKKLTEVVVVLASNDNYAFGLGITIASFLRFITAEYKILIYIIDNGISQNNKQRIETIVESFAVDVVTKFTSANLLSLKGLPVHHHFTLDAYSRLLIPEIVDSAFEKVIYLDSDLLIRNNICKLWEIDIENYALLACQDLSSYSDDVIKDDILTKGSYFNSGVMVFNLKKWRSENLSLRIIEFLKINYDSNSFADQCGLNAVLKNDWKPLDIKWNVLTILSSDQVFSVIPESSLKNYLTTHKDRLLDEAYILHFIGTRKPWKNGCGMIGQIEWLNVMRSCNWFSSDEFLKSSFLFLALNYDYYQRRFYRFLKKVYNVVIWK